MKFLEKIYESDKVSPILRNKINKKIRKFKDKKYNLKKQNYQRYNTKYPKNKIINFYKITLEKIFNKKKQKNLFENPENGFSLIDYNGDFIWADKKGCKFLEIPNFKSKNFFELFIPFSKNRILKRFGREIFGRKNCLGSEISFRGVIYSRKAKNDFVKYLKKSDKKDFYLEKQKLIFDFNEKNLNLEKNDNKVKIGNFSEDKKGNGFYKGENDLEKIENEINLRKIENEVYLRKNDNEINLGNIENGDNLAKIEIKNRFVFEEEKIDKEKSENKNSFENIKRIDYNFDREEFNFKSNEIKTENFENKNFFEIEKKPGLFENENEKNIFSTQKKIENQNNFKIENNTYSNFQNKKVPNLKNEKTNENKIFQNSQNIFLEEKLAIFYKFLKSLQFKIKIIPLSLINSDDIINGKQNSEINITNDFIKIKNNDKIQNKFKIAFLCEIWNSNSVPDFDYFRMYNDKVILEFEQFVKKKVNC